MPTHQTLVPLTQALGDALEIKEVSAVPPGGPDAYVETACLGTNIEALLTYRRPQIGVTAEKGVDRGDFSCVYPHFQSGHG